MRKRTWWPLPSLAFLPLWTKVTKELLFPGFRINFTLIWSVLLFLESFWSLSTVHSVGLSSSLPCT